MDGSAGGGVSDGGMVEALSGSEAGLQGVRKREGGSKAHHAEDGADRLGGRHRLALERAAVCSAHGTPGRSAERIIWRGGLGEERWRLLAAEACRFPSC